jgi:hypothetical protein
MNVSTIEHAAERSKAFKADAESRIPTWAKAVIVAQMEIDDSDPMSDYFNTKTGRTVILAFSPHGRDLFPELRQAVRHFPDAAHLADAPNSAEHREKWSMGAGYYLKASGRYSTGWTVRKVRLYGDRPAHSIPEGEWLLAPDVAKASKARATDATDAAQSLTSGAARIEKHHHTKHGFDFWLVVLLNRVDRAEYDRLLSEAKARGGWYSKAWAGTPGGFAFKSEAAARAFAGMTGGNGPDGGDKPDTDAPDAPAAAPAPDANARLAGNLRDMANDMQSEIDNAGRDRLANTPKRKRQADAMRIEWRRLKRTQAGLRAMADAIDAGTLPGDLRGVTSKRVAYDLARSFIDHSRAGYYDAGHDTDKPALDTPAARAFWTLIAPRSDADRKADELRAKIGALQFANIPGFFPTPRAVVATMLEHADVKPGMLILEPSAGAGAILDEIAAAHPGARLAAFERHGALADILKAKGYTVDQCDFTEREPEATFDRVLMNPPFENGQDAAHVRIAFAHLKPGGRLVAIMSPGPFFRSDERSRSFRMWFEESGGEKYELPEGSFRASGTGVSTVLVVIEKGEA